jgi:hypothetical protein
MSDCHSLPVMFEHFSIRSNHCPVVAAGCIYNTRTTCASLQKQPKCKAGRSLTQMREKCDILIDSCLCTGDIVIPAPLLVWVFGCANTRNHTQMCFELLLVGS